MSWFFRSFPWCGLALLLWTAAVTANDLWYSVDDEGIARVDLYFFWTATCPHCAKARPFLADLTAREPWLRLHSLELTGHPDNIDRYIELAGQVGGTAQSVPGFIFCGQLYQGFDNAEGMGAFLLDRLRECRAVAQRGQAVAATPVEPLTLPLVGAIDPHAWSLPVFTLVIAGLDAFNPCAFFVLLFLLSLLVHARSRVRMFLIGGVFVLFSGLVYFVFMAAWLNVFLWLGELTLLTAAAGLLAVVVALLNIKDYFWFKQGVSLSIPEGAKPSLFARMRQLVHAESLPTLLLGTVALAVVANSYELLCTAGFPMVYTRVLTLNGLEPTTYYLYLVFYNIIYVIPLALIVVVFTLTLGARKLSEHEGRVLKLISGLMMLELGLLLLVAPELLGNVLVALLLIVVAVGVTAAVVWVDRLARAAA